MYAIIKNQVDIDGTIFTSYGIKCENAYMNFQIENICLNSSEIKELLNELVRFEILPMHLKDYIEDFMAK